MQLAIIAAVARNGVIGQDNRLPWRLPDDMRHFMQSTRGRPVIMGRRTFESMPGALPDRYNLVVTRNPDWSAPGVRTTSSFQQALALAEHHVMETEGDCAFAIGGTGVYVAALPFAQRLLITWVEAEPEGDAVFPPVNWAEWREVATRAHAADARHAHAFRIVDYERVIDTA